MKTNIINNELNLIKNKKGRKMQGDKREVDRIEWVDVCKFICIFFVIMTHFSFVTNEIMNFYRPFFLYLFFFLSGYFFKKDEHFLNLMKKKFKTVFIPWLFFSVLIIILSQILTFNEHKPLRTELFWNALQIFGKGDQMWFLAALFVAYIPMWIYVNKMSHKYAMLLAFMLFVLQKMYAWFVPNQIFPWGTNTLPWHLEYIFIASFFLYLGYSYKNFYEKPLKKFEKPSVLIVLFLIYLILLYLSLVVFCDFLNENFFLDFSVELLKTGISMWLCIILSKIIKSPSRFVLFVGKNTLAYFGLHGKVISLLEVVISNFGIVLNSVPKVVLCAVILILTTMIILIFPVMFINRYLPFAVGK